MDLRRADPRHTKVQAAIPGHPRRLELSCKRPLRKQGASKDAPEGRLRRRLRSLDRPSRPLRVEGFGFSSRCRSVGIAQASARELKHSRNQIRARAPCSPVRDLGFSMHWAPKPVPSSLRSGSPFIRHPPTTIAPFPSPRSIFPRACGAISIASSRPPPQDQTSLMEFSFSYQRLAADRAEKFAPPKLALAARSSLRLLSLRHGISSPVAGLAPDATRASEDPRPRND